MRPRRFAPTCNPPLAGLDYTALHPFSGWSSPHLQTLIGGWLQLDPPCLELATLALNELTRRGDDLNARMRFQRADLPPVPWLDPARRAVLSTFTADRPHGRGKGTVYVLLRGGYTSNSGWYGAYVGSTAKPLAKRFAEHRRGGARAARGLEKHGIEPLYSLFLPINPVPSTRAVLQEWETRLHECLAPLVPKVTGDVAF